MRISNQAFGIILAGGRSSRFGQDKGLFPYQGKPLVEHAIDILRPNVSNLAISTNNYNAYSYFGLPMIADTYPDCGPIGGIFSALRTVEAKNHMPSSRQHVGAKNFSPPDGDQTPYVSLLPHHTNPKQQKLAIAVISCDTPHIPPALFAYLLQYLDNYDAIVPVHNGFKETTCAIYTTACLPHFEHAIKQKRFKILDALAGVHTRYLDVSTTAFYQPGIFHNINYREDLRSEK